MNKNKTNYQRKLLIVPILHTEQDMGSLGHRLMANSDYHAQAYDYWKTIEAQIRGLSYEFDRMKVYQDGLPDTKPDLVEKIASEVQSPNYKLLRWLRDQGATIVGTENPDLIKEEYSLLKAILEAKNESQKLEARKRYQERADALLSLRDAYIAQRINQTLEAKELGILFLGAAHKIEDVLPVDIKVIDFDTQKQQLQIN